MRGLISVQFKLEWDTGMRIVGLLSALRSCTSAGIPVEGTGDSVAPIGIWAQIARVAPVPAKPMPIKRTAAKETGLARLCQNMFSIPVSLRYYYSPESFCAARIPYHGLPGRARARAGCPWYDFGCGSAALCTMRRATL